MLNNKNFKPVNSQCKLVMYIIKAGDIDVFTGRLRPVVRVQAASVYDVNANAVQHTCFL
jgi:hypothetical protein